MYGLALMLPGGDQDNADLHVQICCCSLKHKSLAYRYVQNIMFPGLQAINN